jgi:glycosyltransferase involved in cell wall biosynthesis
MKIAWFGHVASARRNGKVSYTRSMVKGLHERGIPVVFFYHAFREPDVVVPPCAHPVPVQAFDFWNRATVSLPQTGRTIENVLDQERPSLAHVSFSFSNLDTAIPGWCHARGIPVVGTWHMPFGPPSSPWGIAMDMGHRLYINTLAKYDAVIITSERQKSILAKYGVPASRLHVIPNSIDLELFSPGQPDYKRELGARLLVSYVGRIDPEKNVGVLCDAFLALNLPADHKLVIVGAGTNLGQLRRKFKDPHIIFRGHIADQLELARIFRASDINVLPSSVEGHSLAMLEAMACGAAMIVSDVGADGETVRGAGIVLDLENLSGQLSLALRQLIEFPKFRRELGELARCRAVEHFSLKTNLDNLLRLYAALDCL